MAAATVRYILSKVKLQPKLLPLKVPTVPKLLIDEPKPTKLYKKIFQVYLVLSVYKSYKSNKSSKNDGKK